MINVVGGTVKTESHDDLSLSLESTASADKLWIHRQCLSDLVNKASVQMTETGQRWKETTDRVVKDRIWADYEAQAREFRVLASWKDVFYAAFIFSIDGAFCAALDDHCHQNTGQAFPTGFRNCEVHRKLGVGGAGARAAAVAPILTCGLPQA